MSHSLTAAGEAASRTSQLIAEMKPSIYECAATRHTYIHFHDDHSSITPLLGEFHRVVGEGSVRGFDWRPVHQYQCTSCEHVAGGQQELLAFIAQSNGAVW